MFQPHKNPMSRVLLLLILSRSDRRKPGRQRRSWPRSYGYDHNSVSNFSSVCSFLHYPSVPILEYTRTYSYHACKCLTNLTHIVSPRRHSDTGTSHSLPWPNTLLSLPSPLPQKSHWEPNKLLSTFQWCQVVSGLGTFACTVSSPQTRLLHLTQIHLPVPPFAWR